MRLFESILAIALLLALLISPVVWMIDQVIDPTDNTDPVIAEENADTEDSAFNLLVELLSSINEEGVATLHIDKYDMNELLYSLTASLDLGEVRARSLYIEEGESGHRLCIPISVFGIDTMVSGGLSLYTEEGLICLGVSDLRLAKLSLGSDLISSLNLGEKIVGAFRDLGVNAEMNGDSLIVKLSREAIGTILNTALANDPNGQLFMALYNLLMLRSDAVEITINSPVDATVTLDLGIFGVNKSDKLASVNEYTKGLLDRQVIGRDDVELISTYYVNGYSKLSDEDKMRVSSLLSAEQSADAIASYGGLVEREQFSVSELLLHQLDISPDAFLPGFKISDGNINSMLSDLELVGTVWQFASSRDNTCAYIAVQDLYCAISDNKIKVYLDIDLNGYVLTVSADFNTGKSHLVSITGTLGEVWVGSFALASGEVDLVFGFLCDNLKESWIYADREARMLTLDFTSTFEDNFLLSAVLNTSKSIVTTCEKSLLGDGGFVYISMRLI